jgi:hypothetical protein
MTARFLEKDGTPFQLVVEPGEEAAYRDAFPNAEILVLPADDFTLLGARNWIRDHSIAAGFERHWQLDDNIRNIRRLWRGKRIPCDSGPALRVCEDFTDRYDNIGVSGLNYQMFVLDETPVPFYLNVHVYSCSLIWNRMPYRWRLLYNDDTDLCLQVLAGGLCTVALNVFMADKQRTGEARGGNTDSIYRGDGRAKMARSLERQWPGVVETRRRFNRPQHVVKDSWKRFDTPLHRRADVNFDALAEVDDYGLRLVQVADEIRSPAIRELLDDRPA